MTAKANTAFGIVVILCFCCCCSYNNAQNNQPNGARELILGIRIDNNIINSIAEAFQTILVGCRLTANENHHRRFFAICVLEASRCTSINIRQIINITINLLTTFELCIDDRWLIVIYSATGNYQQQQFTIEGE